MGLVSPRINSVPFRYGATYCKVWPLEAEDQQALPYAPLEYPDGQQRAALVAVPMKILVDPKPHVSDSVKFCAIVQECGHIAGESDNPQWRLGLLLRIWTVKVET
jgi:hypothetical protein